MTENNGAPAPEANNTPAPAPEGGAPAPAPEGGAPAPAQAPAPTDWTASLPDELKGYAANKGWEDPAKAVQSYRDLEKFSGSKANFAEIPDPTDADAVKAVMQRMGTPTDVDGYVINLPEGIASDAPMMTSFKTAALDMNLTTAQAQGMTEWFEGFKGDATADMAATSEATVNQAIADLKTEWGNEFDSNIASGQNLTRAIGLSVEELDALEGHMGTPALMGLMAKLGSKLGDNTLIGIDGDGGGGYKKTPEQARAKIGELGGDPAFRKRMYDPTAPGHKAALSEMEQLQLIASGQ